MRPPGEIRCAVLNAAQALTAERGQGATCRDLAERACVSLRAARQAVKNMARAGELVRVGSTPVPGSRRPMTMFAPPVEQAAGPAALAALMSTWCRGAE
jgi:hypothetical protein